MAHFKRKAPPTPAIAPSLLHVRAHRQSAKTEKIGSPCATGENPSSSGAALPVNPPKDFRAGTEVLHRPAISLPSTPRTEVTLCSRLGVCERAAQGHWWDFGNPMKPCFRCRYGRAWRPSDATRPVQIAGDGGASHPAGTAHPLGVLKPISGEPSLETRTGTVIDSGGL